MQNVINTIRDIPDFPKEGILFKDITPVLQNPETFREVIDAFQKRYEETDITHIAAIESRGFIFGAPLAYNLNVGFVLLRKPGKLPYKTYKEEYELEYGTDAIEIHQDAFGKNDRVVLVDDLLATGGTALAAAKLIKKTGATIHEISFLIELSFLNAKEKLGSYPCHSFISF